jgi:hypothetical protein
MKKLSILFFVIIIVLTSFSCGDNDNSSVNYFIMEMKLVAVFQQDTITFNFSYHEGQLKQATISGRSINKAYTADYDANGKVIDAGNKRFEWEGDRLIKIIDDNGIWTDLTYSGDKLTKGELFKYDQNNEIVSAGNLAISDNGQNISGIDIANVSDEVIAKHTFSAFDNKVNLFKAIWWIHYVGEGLSSFRSGVVPEALFMDSNPVTYKYELPQLPFDRTINYNYTYDDQGRVTLVEYQVGVDQYELIVSY